MRKAFTLIELLVVIAIIATLAAILFPVFAQAKAAAKKTVGLSDAKQIALAGQMYATDADDCVVINVSVASPVMYWADLLQPYIKNLALFAPPAGQMNEFWQSGTSRVAKGKADMGFTINNAYWYNATHGEVFERYYQTSSMTSFADTSKCVFAADGGQDGTNYTDGFQVVANPINADGVPDLALGKLTSGPLNGRLILGSKANRQGFFLARYNNDSLTSSFFDGHAKSMKMDQLAKTNSAGHYVYLSKADLSQ